MRRVGFVFSIVTFLMAACSEELTGPSGNGAQTGEITIALSSEDAHQNVAEVKSTVGTPEAEAFKVEIFNASGVRLYRDTYGNAAGEKIPLNAGEYRLLASYGDPLAVGFDAIYFAADRNFTVHGQTSETVEAVARMSNVKVAVSFGENLSAYYPEHYARVRNTAVRDFLQFESDETRAGYIPAGNLVLEIYAEVDGTWKYYKSGAAEYAPNDFVTFNVDTDPREGQLSVSVKIDDAVDVVEKEISISSEYAPDAAPAIELSGFNDNGYFAFEEGSDCSGIQADFVVPAGIASCVFNIESEYLSSRGLPSEVDLLTAGDDVRAQFLQYGIRWNDGMENAHFGSVDFSGLGRVQYDPASEFTASFSIKVTDKNGKETVSETYTILQKPVFTLKASDENAFARRVEGLTAEIKAADPSKLTLQYGTDNSSWTDVTASSVEGQTVKFDVVSGLQPATEYKFRLVYGGDENTAGEPVSLTTEAAQQIGNSGFEEWTDETFDFTLGLSIFSSDKSITWYRPWISGGEQWWDVNSKYTMPGDYTYISLNQNRCNFPSVGYSILDKNSGSRSAKIYTVWVGYSIDGIDRLSAGELFIGTANDDGSHATEGHSFASRPDALSFSYLYEAVNDENFYVRAELRDASGNAFAVGETTSGPASGSWTKYELPLTYSDITKKASSIYVTFKSSSASTPSYSEKSFSVGSNGNGGENTYSSGCNIGSILYVDDLELIYE